MPTSTTSDDPGSPGPVRRSPLSGARRLLSTPGGLPVGPSLPTIAGPCVGAARAAGGRRPMPTRPGDVDV